MTAIFVADESCPWPVVAAVREAGFDITSIQEDAPGSADDAILRNSVAPGRVVLTQDRDFGELVMRGGAAAVGVVYIRLRGRDWGAIAARVVAALHEIGDQANGAICVIDWTNVRVRQFKAE